MALMPPIAFTGPRKGLLILLLGLGLVLAAVAAYWPVAHNDWIMYDDTVYLVDNEVVKQGLTTEGFAWSLTSFKGGNWHPLTWLSIMLDVELWGMNMGGHHISGLVLHTLSTILLFLALALMTGAPWQSAFVAAAFALHPLHVESVAWIAERKDTLSGLFFMVTLCSYWWYVQRPGVFRYLLVFLSVALGLMSKPMLVTLPLVLLLLDYWPLKRFPFGANADTAKPVLRTTLKLVLEKLPMLALAAAISAVTVVAQRESEALRSFEAVPLDLRVQNSIVSYLTYLRKTVWPSDLALFYPYQKNLPVAEVLVALAILVGVTALAVFLWRRRPYLSVGWFWYLGTLVPVIGLIQVGKQPYADRYTYLPLIGVFIIVAWGMADLIPIRGRRILLAVAATAVLTTWGWVAQTQVRHWRDSVSMYEHTLSVTEGNYMIHYNLGKFFQDQKRHEEAIAHYRAAIQIAPGFGLPHNNLALLLPPSETEEIIEHLRAAARFSPGNPEIQNNLANALSNQGLYDEADLHFRESIRLRPTANAYSNRALNLIKAGRYDEAASSAGMAVRLNPRYPQARNSLATAYAKQGKAGEAIAQYREALRLMPGWPPAERRLAWLLATHPDPQFRDAQEALRLAQHASSRTGNRDPDMLDTLAAAMAEAGEFEQAVAIGERAAARADATGKTSLAAAIRQRTALYRSGRPYRETAASATMGT